MPNSCDSYMVYSTNSNKYKAELMTQAFLTTFLLGVLAYGTFFIDIEDFPDRLLREAAKKDLFLVARPVRSNPPPP